MDGKLNEPAWRKSQTVSNFIVSFPRQGGHATYQTEVKVLYDDENLYVGAICHLPEAKKKIKVQDMRRDFSYNENELFNVLIDPFSNPTLPVSSFWTTPYGTQTDMMIYDDRIYDYNWDAAWKVKCSIEDSFWVAEYAIPFSTLRYPGDSTTWTINFNRNIRSIGERSGWSPWPLAYTAARLSYGGLLVNIKPPKPKVNLRVQPYSLVKFTNTNSGSDSKVQIGGDLKWAINTNTVVDGTVKTDFAQADVDRQVFNLNRSSIFLPEKRQFFLENAYLFSIGQTGIIEPFFIRRIGLNDDGVPLPLDGGLRLIHQTTKQSVGTLFLKQRGDSINNGAYFAVGRYQKNITQRLRLGTLTTLRFNEQNQYQKSCSNAVVSVDGFWRITQPFYIRPMVSYSKNTGTGKTGYAAFTEVTYGLNWLIATLYETVVFPGYSVETGYLARENFINTQPNINFYLQKKWFPKYLAYFAPYIKADIFHTASTGALQEAKWNIAPVGFATRRNTQIYLYVSPSTQVLNYNFQPLPGINIKAGKYNFTRFGISGFTNQSAKFSMQTESSIGPYYNGHLNAYFIALRAVPILHISVILSYTRNELKNVGDSVKNLTSELIAPEVRLALNPKVQLSGFYQYNSIINKGALNVRFSWEYKPLSYFYIVYNGIQTVNKTPADQFKQETEILKLSYLKQF
ncbi:MAG: carbohydrate binding family 9 domain-containing protein [Chitinophagaceae bacterium]|nr:carbohydrate binding family 9 domain-containing protein [Chitinophagaceae bacterium]